MIDIHTHILPGMDDGAKDIAVSLEMLALEQSQGVDTVVLTPHFYRDKEHPAHFLERRAKAYKSLQRAVGEADGLIVKLVLGAEVAWVPNMPQWPELTQFCIQGSSYMLLEMPFYRWNEGMLRQVYELMDMGITPIFAHLERYLSIQKPEYIQAILEMGVPIQVSSSPLLHFGKRRQVLHMLKKGQAHLMASDCHNLTTRPPNLASGMSVVEKKLGTEMAHLIEENTMALRLGDSAGKQCRC